MKKVTVGTVVEYKGTEYEVISLNAKIVIMVKTSDTSDEPKQYRVQVGSDRYNEIFSETTEPVKETPAPVKKTKKAPVVEEPEEESDETDDEYDDEPEETVEDEEETVEDEEETVEDEEETPAPVKKTKKAPVVDETPAPVKKTKKVKEVKEPEPELADFAWDDFLPFTNRIDQIIVGATPSERLVRAAMYSAIDKFTAFMVWTFINTDKFNVDFDTIAELLLDGEKPVVADKDRPKEFNDDVITDMWNWLDQFGMTDKIPAEYAHIEFIRLVPVEGQEYFFYIATNLGWNSFQSLKINKEAANSIIPIRTTFEVEGLI